VVLIGRLDDRLTDSRLKVRCATLLTVAVVVFVVSWALAFWLLPLGVLRGRTGGAMLAGGDEAVSGYAVELVRIFAVNLALAAVVVVAPNLLRTRGGVPLGYSSVIVMIAMGTGTNSFSIQVGSATKLAPSLELLGNPGPYELAAYVLATTAAYGIGRWQLVGPWPHSTAPRIVPKPAPVRHAVVGLCSATALLFTMAAWEAQRIIAAVR